MDIQQIDDKIVWPEEAFEEFPKIARLSRECIVTEKLDGTNAQVAITQDGDVRAGSRNRWITPESDNFGFARWVKENEDKLRVILGPGRHFGEWWGAGIGRRYDLKEKRLSLFNTSRWCESEEIFRLSGLPIHTVPVLYQGMFSTEAIGTQIERLRTLGSVAAPGFKKPEGVVIFHTASKTLFKKTVEKDESPKGLVSPGDA